MDASTGIISTIAGTGVEGFNGDGILATSAQVSKPSGIAIDSLGNIYISEKDWGGYVRKIDVATGMINIIAGGGTKAGFDVFDVPALEALFNFPRGLTVYAGELYMAVALISRVYKLAL